MRHGARVLFAMCAVLSTAVAAQTPTFSTRVVSVRVDALVLDEHGQPIDGLRASDFEMTDDGVPQKVDLLAAGQVPVNVVLALDMSESTAGDRLAGLRAAARAVVEGMRPNDQAALITFNGAVSRGTALTTDIGRVATALERASAEGGTSVFDAAYAAITVGRSDVGRTLIILFSDGVDTTSWLNPAWVILAARRSNAVVYSVTVDAAKRLTFLPELGRVTGGTSYPIESSRDLAGTFARILEEFRHRYLLSFTPTGVAETGWHTLQVRVKDRRAVVKAREGYGG